MKALKFPFQISGGGEVSFVSDEADAVEQEILMAVLTSIGERVMRHTYGSRVHDLVFENADELTAAEAHEYTTKAVERWVPSARLIDVRTETPEGAEDDAFIRVSVLFQVRASLDAVTYVARLKVNNEVVERAV